MKLKIYLRGLGVGILVTAIIMGVAMKDKLPLTDAEIRKRAIELGMVDSNSLTLSDAENTSSETASESAVVETSVEESESEEPTSEETSTEETSTEETSSEETSTEETSSEETSSEEASTEEASSEEKQTVTITVKSGSGSESVCKQLEQAGLIQDAKAFDRYLSANGYATRISVGTYEIEMGTSEEQIAKIITRSK